MAARLLLLLSSLSLTLAGCGGSESSQEEGGASGVKTLKSGIFLDSRVANINYKTESQTGTTNIHGEFNYYSGESITFSIGDLELPKVKAGGIITPMTLAGSASIYNQTATNIAILLQSLDEDGVLSGGITIPAGAKLSAPSAIDFAQSTSEFINNNDVINMVANAGAHNTSLVSATSAQEHMQTSLNSLTPYIGAWSFITDKSEQYLILFADNTFIYAENDDQLPNGLEFGRYSYESYDDNLILTIFYDNNGPGEDSGVGDIGTDVITDIELLNSNSQLKILNGDLVFNSENLNSESVVGAWSSTIGNDFQLVLFSNNKFLIAQTSNSRPNGLQLGTYAYDSIAEELTLSLTYDDASDPSGIDGITDDIVMRAVLSDQNTLSLMNNSLILNRSL